jgi:hypothetical protein
MLPVGQPIKKTRSRSCCNARLRLCPFSTNVELHAVCCEVFPRLAAQSHAGSSVQIKRGPRTHYSAAQKGTATGDYTRGCRRLARPSATEFAVLPVGQPTLKPAICVQVLTKPRLSSFSTMWNFALQKGHRSFPIECFSFQRSKSASDFHQDAECSNDVGKHRDQKRERTVNEIPCHCEDRQQHRYNDGRRIRRMNSDFHCRKPRLSKSAGVCFSNDDQSRPCKICRRSSSAISLKS